VLEKIVELLSDDGLPLNLLSEAIGILVTVIVITPLVSWIVSLKRSTEVRYDRVKM
jgi:hypothetical protein